MELVNLVYVPAVTGTSTIDRLEVRKRVWLGSNFEVLRFPLWNFTGNGY